ncbi:MAG: glucose-specific enzyme component [Haloplasmataceae bacterium]|jgi:phosphotransferase system IIB component|nr:glucose-specific enzyme component [Haloplasmataceae bacterium]
MKKAHINNFILILIAYLIPFFINEYYYFINKDVNDTIRLVASLSIIILILLPSIYFLVNQVFDIFIKRVKKINLVKIRVITFIITLISTFTFIYFYIEYYFYFGSIILLYVFYFIYLYFLDNRYIKKSIENKIKINDHLVNDFLILLGGKENIVNVSYESSRLKVEVKNIRIVNLEKIKDLGAQGLFIAGNKLQAIVGNNASDLENAIKRYLTNVY